MSKRVNKAKRIKKLEEEENTKAMDNYDSSEEEDKSLVKKIKKKEQKPKKPKKNKKKTKKSPPKKSTFSEDEDTQPSEKVTNIAVVPKDTEDKKEEKETKKEEKPKKKKKVKRAKSVVPAPETQNSKQLKSNEDDSKDDKEDTKKSVPKKKQKKKPKKRTLPEDTEDPDVSDLDIKKPKKRRRKKTVDSEEEGEDEKVKKWPRYIPRAEKDDARMKKALKERIYLVEAIEPESENQLSREFVVMGTRGNEYTVTIDRHPHCTCPDYTHRKGRCKHCFFVLMRIMKVEGDMVQQYYYDKNELREMFNNIPEITANLYDRNINKAFEDEESTKDSEEFVKQKPIEGDCPICLTSLEIGEVDFCKKCCGNNVHVDCFRRWAQKKKEFCVYCRAPWIYAKNNKRSKSCF